MSELEAKLRDEILEHLKNERTDVWTNALKLSMAFDKRTKYFDDTLNAMAKDGYIRTEMIFNYPHKQSHYKITDIGREFTLFHGGYTQKYKDELAAREEKELNKNVGKSVMNTNRFIKLTFGAVLAATILQGISIVVTHYDATKAQEKNVLQPVSNSQLHQTTPKICPHDSI